jgi:hypothetical protein
MLINNSEIFERLTYLPETGEFFYNKDVSCRMKKGFIAGYKNKNGYIVIGIKGKIFQAHRLAWLFVFGVFPDKEIDHINGIKTDNRISNLRNVSKIVNLQNIKKAFKHNLSSGLLGVSLVKKSGKYKSRININGKTKHLGCFDTAEEAHNKYLVEKRKYHSGCTI